MRSQVGQTFDSDESKALVIGLPLLIALVLFALVILAPILVIEDMLGAGTGSTTTEIGPGSPIPSALVPVFNEAGSVFHVDPYLLASVAYQESTFGSAASHTVNYAGCVGFMQTCIGGAGGDSWDSTVTLTADPKMTLAERFAYKLGTRPSGYPGETADHPDYNDPFDGVMAGAVELRGKVGGVPIPSLDATAQRALCGYYGACADASANYAQDVLDRARLWESESALSPTNTGLGPISASGYVNPFTGDAVVSSGRIDQGVDADLAPGEPIRAVGLAQVVGTIQNWYAGQPLIWYQLLSGPYRGKYVYIAEQIDRLATGRLLPGQPVAYYAGSGTGIETGWALADGETLARANGGYTEGRSTAAGGSFNRFLQALHAPVCLSALCGLHQPFQGTLPAGYP